MKENLGKFGILYILLTLGIGIFIGQTKWFKKLFMPSANGNQNGTNSNGNGGRPIDQESVQRGNSSQRIYSNTFDINEQKLIALGASPDKISRFKQHIANNPNSSRFWIDWCHQFLGFPLGVCNDIYGKVQSPSIQSIPTQQKAPATILLPVSANCPRYNTANPYHYMGCSYVFGGYVLSLGKRKCLLKLVSCP